MQAGGGLVQHVDGPARGAALELGGQLDPLGLTPRQGGRRLAQAHVAQAHVGQGGQVAGDHGGRGEEVGGLADRHVQHVGHRPVLVADLQGLAVVAGPVAGLAGHVDVGQEVHLDPQGAVALTGLAAPALDVEGEAPRAVAAHPRLRHGGEDLAHVVPHAGVGGRVGARGAPDGRLVDVDHLVQVLQAAHGPVASGHAPGVVEAVGQHLVEDRVDQGGLARPGDPGDGGQQAQGEGDGDVPQVVLPGPHHRDLPAPLAPAPPVGDLDATATGQVVPGDGARHVGQGVHRPGVDDLPAPLPRARADVHHPVRRAYGVLVVLDDNEGVAQVPQPLEGLNETGVVPLVQADAGLVQHVEHTHQPRPDLGGQADALGLPARQGGRAPGQAEVVQAHVHQEAQAGVDLGQHAAGDPRGLAG